MTIHWHSCVGFVGLTEKREWLNQILLSQRNIESLIGTLAHLQAHWRQWDWWYSRRNPAWTSDHIEFAGQLEKVIFVFKFSTLEVTEKQKQPHKDFSFWSHFSAKNSCLRDNFLDTELHIQISWFLHAVCKLPLFNLQIAWTVLNI